eukprot:2625345-Pyramimonas_sp.AAC.1
MPSTAPPGKSNEQVECDLLFYKQERKIVHIIDRCIRYATGLEIPDKTMTSILDAYHQCWMLFGHAKLFNSDGEGALNNDAAKAVLKAKGTELRHLRVHDALRRSKPEAAYCAIYFLSWKLNSTALFAADAFTYYKEVSPCSSLFGRQPAMLPDLPILEHVLPMEMSDHSREQMMRKACIEATTQANAAAKTNRALRTKTTIT